MLIARKVDRANEALPSRFVVQVRGRFRFASIPLGLPGLTRLATPRAEIWWSRTCYDSLKE